MDDLTEKQESAARILEAIGIIKIKNHMTKEQKAFQILKAWHDLAHEKEGYIKIVSDWDLNTLTIYTDGNHQHFGQMDNEGEKGFEILIDELYEYFCKPNKG
jgi:hypothetical protein